MANEVHRLVRGIGKRDQSALGLSPKTVSTYRTRLMEKLHFATNADLVRYSAEHGLSDYIIQNGASDPALGG